MDNLDQATLALVVCREVEDYEGVSLQGKLYAISDDTRQRYVVTFVDEQPSKTSDAGNVIVQAHIEDDVVVIDIDSVWDKNLWKALVAAGVPREQIVLAYEGEQVPAKPEVTP